MGSAETGVCGDWRHRNGRLQRLAPPKRVAVEMSSGNKDGHGDRRRGEGWQRRRVAAETCGSEDGRHSNCRPQRWVATETGATETGATETGATETGATEMGATETGAMETGATEAGATETVTTETGATKTGGHEDGRHGDGRPRRRAPWRRAPQRQASL